MSHEYPRFRAAAVQAAPVFLDKAATLDKACRLIAEAAANGARLIVFPETYIPTYAYWVPDFSTHSGPWVYAWRELLRNAVEVPSEDTQTLGEAARKARAYVVMGLNERDRRSQGTLYNSLILLDDQGRLIGRHRKLMPTHHERMFWGQGDGSGLQVVETLLGRLGGLICYEHLMPLARYAMFAKGEQIHCALWPGWPAWPEYNSRDRVDAACRHYAAEGQVFVVVAASYITPEMVPDTFPFKKKTRWDSFGGSAIISPQGRYLAGPVYDQEAIIYADIDLGLIPLAKAIVDSVGHYARPDVLRLMVNEAVQEPCRAMGAAVEGASWWQGQAALEGPPAQEETAGA